jgi:hypothetical protein
MERAKTLFKHAFESYKKIFDNERQAKNSLSAPVASTSCPSGSTSFLDRVCSFNVAAGLLPAVKVGELELFYAAPVMYGPGVRKTPLAWWKVSLSMVVPLSDSQLHPEVRHALSCDLKNGA